MLEEVELDKLLKIVLAIVTVLLVEGIGVKTVKPTVDQLVFVTVLLITGIGVEPIMRLAKVLVPTDEPLVALFDIRSFQKYFKSEFEILMKFD